MPTSLLRAVSQQESAVDSQTAPTSYTTAGMSIRSSVGRVDEVVANSDTNSVEARVTSVTSSNLAHVHLFQQADGAEFSGDEDLSGTEVTLQSWRL